MNDLDKLWELWKNDNQKLAIELVESQGLILYDVLLEFWNNYVEDENEDEYKGIMLSNPTSTGLILNSHNAAFFVYENHKVSDGGCDWWFTTNEEKRKLNFNESNWEMIDEITECSSLEEATQKAILKFIELINKLYNNE